jgi:hypothetical protein
MLSELAAVGGTAVQTAVILVVWGGLGRMSYDCLVQCKEKPSQNWRKGESDCLIKTKHLAGDSVDAM